MSSDAEEDEMPPDLIDLPSTNVEDHNKALQNEGFSATLNQKINDNINNLSQQDIKSAKKKVAVIIDNEKAYCTIEKVPVTILTGFLGSGKSTLLNHILTSPDHGLRIAIIENEFAKGLGIESAIVKDGVDGDTLFKEGEIIELNNGCICCSVKNDLILTLENLLKYKEEKKGQAFDYIIIEASGMANPGPIASCLWMDEELESQLKLDGVVTLVDTFNIHRHLPNLISPALYHRGEESNEEIGTTINLNSNHSRSINNSNTQNTPSKVLNYDKETSKLQLSCTDEAFKQVAYADRILLNKIDLLVENKVNESYIRYIQQKIQQINNIADIHFTEFSRVNVHAVLGLDAYGADNLLRWNQKNVMGSPFQDSCFQKEGKVDLDLNTPEKGNDSNHEYNSNSKSSKHHDNEKCDCDEPHHDIINSSEFEKTSEEVRQSNREKLHSSLSHHKHDTKVISTVLSDDNFKINIEKLRQWVANLLWARMDVTTNYAGHTEDHDPMKTIIIDKRKQNQNSMDVFRMKGLFESSSGEPYLLQGVYDTFDLKACTLNQNMEQDVNHSAEQQLKDLRLAQETRQIQKDHVVEQEKPKINLSVPSTGEWNGKGYRLVVIGKGINHRVLKKTLEDNCH